MSKRNVIVIGGGLIGVSTAYELAQRGYLTTLIEAREGVARETSYANGGLLTPSMSDPWNAPGIHRQVIPSLIDPTAPMRLRLSAFPALISWGMKFLAGSQRAKYTAATRANYFLARYSLECTSKLRETLGLKYDEGLRGTLKVFREAKAMAGPLALARELAPLGLQFATLDRDAVIEAEPALHDVRDQIAGALRFPNDESGDAHKFSAEISAALGRAGGAVKSVTRVSEIRVHRGSVTGVVANEQEIAADAVVVAAGHGTAAMVQKMGIKLPIAPAKGYTVTFEASGIDALPRVPVIDDALHAAITPLGTRLRVAGTVEFAGADTRIRPERIDNLMKLLAAVYPKIAAQLDLTRGIPWAGLRPMSADGRPFIGGTRVKGLYINAGHGHLGWTLASGSARLLADVIAGTPPQIDPEPYRVMR